MRVLTNPRARYRPLVMLAAFLLTSALAAACGATRTPPPTALPTGIPTQTPQAATPTAIPLEDQVTMAYARWNAHHIKSYRIRFEYFESFAVGLTTYRNVTVKSGVVTDEICDKGECPAFVLKSVTSVDALFRMAQGGTIDREHDTIADCLRSIEFDPTYDFPTHIDVDCSVAADDGHSVKVLSFTPLAEP